MLAVMSMFVNHSIIYPYNILNRSMFYAIFSASIDRTGGSVDEVSYLW